MRILFQGDSITDCYRSREDLSCLGTGYPTLVRDQLSLDYPGEYEYINRGVGGNRSVDLYARLKIDLLNLKPDFMSILLGVNDVWHEYLMENGIGAEKFFKVYCMLIEEVLQELPQLKIMIMEPFCLKGEGNEAYYETFRAEVEALAVMAKKVARKYGLTFLPLQEKMDALAEKMPASDILIDGVHPTSIGHTFIKNEWIRTFEEMMK